MKKKTGKSKTGKPVKDLSRKPLNAKTARSVKGGTTSFSYGKIHVEYKPQSDG